MSDQDRIARRVAINQHVGALVDAQEPMTAAEHMVAVEDAAGEYHFRYGADALLPLAVAVQHALEAAAAEAAE